jgi:putative endonuclease
MPAWFVYMLHCGDGSLYTGVSTDVVARIETHNQGRGARYTRSRLPVALALVEKKRSRSAALKREAAVKLLSRAKKLELIARKVAS